jgi:hypothetical protein
MSDDDPSKPLRSLTLERFVLALINSCKTPAEVYAEVFQCGKRVAHQAVRALLLQRGLLARIDYLRQQAATAAVLSLQEKRAFLARIVRTPIYELDRTGPGADLVQEYSEFVSIEGQVRIRLKGCDKLRAVQLDAMLAGELLHRFELSDEFGTKLTPIDDKMTPIEARQAYVETLQLVNGDHQSGKVIEAEAELLSHPYNDDNGNGSKKR